MRSADADVYVKPDRPSQNSMTVRRRSFTFGLSWRILALVVAAVMTAEIAIFLPSIARFRTVYLDQLIESGTLGGAGARRPPDNMVTEEVKRASLNHAVSTPWCSTQQAQAGADDHRAQAQHADLQPQGGGRAMPIWDAAASDGQ